GHSWARFVCYGPLIAGTGATRRELVRVFGEERADAQLERYHELEPTLQAGGGGSYREGMTEAMGALGRQKARRGAKLPGGDDRGDGGSRRTKGRGGWAGSGSARVGRLSGGSRIPRRGTFARLEARPPLEHRPRLHRGVDGADRRSFRACNRRVGDRFVQAAPQALAAVPRGDRRSAGGP